MDGFVAACRPAGALLVPRGVIGTANKNHSALYLLKMAFETEG